MNTNVTSWRELSAQLTGEQIGQLEKRETLHYPPGIATPEQLLASAHAMIRENDIQLRCAGIPAPPDCTGEPSGWLEWDTGIYQRTYTSWQRDCDGFTVEILSSQYSDGRPVERTIWLTYELCDELGRIRDDMDADHARVCGELLIAAADELERIRNDEPPF